MQRCGTTSLPHDALLLSPRHAQTQARAHSLPHNTLRNTRAPRRGRSRRRTETKGRANFAGDGSTADVVRGDASPVEAPRRRAVAVAVVAPGGHVDLIDDGRGRGCRRQRGRSRRRGQGRRRGEDGGRDGEGTDEGDDELVEESHGRFLVLACRRSCCFMFLCPWWSRWQVLALSVKFVQGAKQAPGRRASTKRAVSRSR